MKTMWTHRLAPALVLGGVIAACGGGGTDSGFGSDGTPDAGGGPPSGDGGGTFFPSGDGGGSTFGDGSAPPPPAPLDGGCATATATATRQPVYMLFVLDGSGSMREDNKWTAVVPALDAIFDDIQAQNDRSLGVGLIGFSDSNDGSCTGGLFNTCTGPYPSKTDVPIAFVDKAQHDKLRARIDAAMPSGGTPTQAALTGGFGALEPFVATGALQPGGKKVLVLMTDGVPSGGATEQNACIAAAKTELALPSPKGPITTFAVGIGVFPSTSKVTYDPAFMGALAQAGGAAPAGCNPSENADVSKVCHFQVTPNGKTAAQITQDFIKAIDQIRGQVLSCEFALDKSVGGQVDPSKVNVVFVDKNGVSHPILQDGTNGWTYDDPASPKKVILHGQGCADVKGDPQGKVSIVLGCVTERGPS
jgi:hypothetical protein